MMISWPCLASPSSAAAAANSLSPPLGADVALRSPTAVRNLSSPATVGALRRVRVRWVGAAGPPRAFRLGD